jgi:hypothetical protein
MMSIQGLFDSDPASGTFLTLDLGLGVQDPGWENPARGIRDKLPGSGTLDFLNAVVMRTYFNAFFKLEFAIFTCDFVHKL